ncbi:MAG: class II fructose-bisphosphate aldolase, partial [SAR116 cluster bacterium]|nr:class II fructose-bisphosphate aldolase [SAR116 cluster bacterium]
RTSSICKYIIGPELRMAFGAALRDAVGADQARFDRVQILKETHDPVVAAARRVLAALKPA